MIKSEAFGKIRTARGDRRTMDDKSSDGHGQRMHKKMANSELNDIEERKTKKKIVDDDFNAIIVR